MSLPLVDYPISDSDSDCDEPEADRKSAAEREPPSAAVNDAAPRAAETKQPEGNVDTTEREEESKQAADSGGTAKRKNEAKHAANNLGAAAAFPTREKLLLGCDEQLPPELVRELKRNRRRGGDAALSFLQVDANAALDSDTSAAAGAAPRELKKKRSAYELRRAGVSKAARRNHHISELLAAARADDKASEM